jgi:hypothetical protein
MPFPHICSEITLRAEPGFVRQPVFSLPAVVPSISEPGRTLSKSTTVRENDNIQIFPVEHGEKFISPLAATGLIKNLEAALQVVVDRGQQGVVSLHPSAHYDAKLSILVTLEAENVHIHRA